MVNKDTGGARSSETKDYFKDFSLLELSAEAQLFPGTVDWPTLRGMSVEMNPSLTG